MAYTENNKKETLIIRDARIIRKNFSGVVSQYNRDGKREFSVTIDDPKIAQRLAEDGWNIKILKPRDEGDLPGYCLPVQARYDNFPPRVVVRRPGRPNQELSEATIHHLDSLDIHRVHVNINPSRWDVNGKVGVKAYLKSMIVDVNEDELMSMLAEDEYPAEEPGGHLPF